MITGIELDTTQIRTLIAQAADCPLDNVTIVAKDQTDPAKVVATVTTTFAGASKVQRTLDRAAKAAKQTEGA